MIGMTILFNGHWTESNTYADEDATGILIPDDCSFGELIRKICTSLEINEHEYHIDKKYKMVENGAYLRLNGELPLQFYLEARKYETGFYRYALIVEPKQKEDGFHLNGEDTHQVSTISIHPLVPATDFNPMNDKTLLPSLPTTANLGQELISKASIDFDDVVTAETDVVLDIDGSSIKEGQTNISKEVLRLSVGLNAISSGFQFDTNKSDRLVYHVKCSQAECNWNMRATRVRNTKFFRICQIQGPHICSADNFNIHHKNATDELVANCITYKFVNSRTVYTPADIIRDMQEHYMVKISYDKANRAREKTLKMIRGKPVESYQNLPSYLHMIEASNPGSICRIETDIDNTFLYCFVALGASIASWQCCRPVIVVDATYLTCIYKGTLFTACTQDASDSIFILAYGVGDNENVNSWGWFFEKLKEALGQRENLCIVSDHHRSIASVAEGIFPSAAHVACSYHLLNNLKKGTEVQDHYNVAARSYTLEEFNIHMKNIGTISKEIVGYLEEAGFDGWSRAYMTKIRYSTMTSNIVESVNNVTRTAKNYPSRLCLNACAH